MNLVLLLVLACRAAWIRNPIYVFGGLMIAGVSLWAHRPSWLLLFVLLIPIQLLRVRKEERC